MIRNATPDDAVAILNLAIAADLFAADEIEPLAQVLSEYFAGRLDDGHTWIVDDEHSGLCGVTYYAPAPFSEGTWDLLMIAVRPDCQRQGRGAALVQRVENVLRAQGERLLLVDTSALPAYDRARAFYINCGFEKEACIRDFYKTGDDKIVFRKALNES